MKPRPTKIYRTLLIVEGRGEFPLDMLRYDACVPDTEVDVSSIEHPRVAGEALTVRAVRLLRFSVAGGPASAARWQSFGWTVICEEPLT